MRQTRFTKTATLALLLTLPASALADGNALLDLRNENAEIKQMLMQAQEELIGIREKAEAMRQPASGYTSKEDLIISTTGGGIKVKSANGNTFRASGLLEFDHDS